MLVINKNRLTLLAHLIASCAALSACGGGSGSADVATAASATDTSEADRAAALSNAPAAAAATAAATAAAATSTTAATNATAASVSAPAADTGPVTTTTLSATTMAINNPERGFYGWGGSYLTGFTAANLASIRSSGYSLALSLIDLSAYRGQNIPQSYLDTLTAKFAMVRSGGVKVVVRAVYNYDSSGADAQLSQVKAHLAQLAPLFAANADVIGYVQAGFIGAWGEWHDSASGLTTDSNKAAVRDAVLAAVPSQFPVQFRYPYDIIKWFPAALTSANAFNGSAQSRMSVHNDCFMASDNDVGTYQSNSLTNNSQREYTKTITEYGPFGGETCGGFSPARMTCAQILQEGAQYHLAYLNITYDANFINSWKSGGCFDQVARSIGYRLQVDQVVAPITAQRNTAITVNVDLHNVGWSRMFSARKLVVTLRNKSTGALISGTGTTDMRSLPSQSTAATRAPVTVTIPSSAAAGEYDVLLGMPDIYSSTASDVRYSVRFANADDTSKGQAWDAANARLATGSSITVQ